MSTAVSQPISNAWLAEHGPKELEQLLRVIVFQPTVPLLLTDDSRHSVEASVGAAKLLGIPRDKVVGSKIDEFSAPNIKPIIDAEVLPKRHLVVLFDETTTPSEADVPSWVRDYALFLLNVDGQIGGWYAGAERLYGYQPSEILGQTASKFYPDADGQRKLQEELKRAATEGHVGTEGWRVRKDGSRFWASVLTVALKDEQGVLQGFGRAVRDFTDRRERDEKLRRGMASHPLPPAISSVSGIVSGEFDRIPEANDTFLSMVGYSREDLEAGRLHWPDLTPPEYRALDELAHEEGLRFGGCTPFEKELLHKNGIRIPVLVSTAILKLSPFKWITFVQDLRERNRQERVIEEVVESKNTFEEIIGSSAAMKRVLGQVEVVAPTDATVLILGETGTGKELIARALHKMGPRKNFAFVTLNCAAIPTGLLESELFGYERGAFTGALSQKIGRFEMANRGTLFLDEVGDIPIDLQPKLLRALQEKSFERLGGTKTIAIDVRLVAATNRNLTQMMGDKLFRPDLYYRLKVFPITTPPLRDRPDDIPMLVRHFTKKYAAKMDRIIETIPTDIMKALVHWPWPGNVRELENFIERSVILSPGSSLRAPIAELREDEEESGQSSTLEDVERDHILQVFRESGGVVSATAARLGMPRTTLNAMMKKLGISRSDL
jgi:PAS domain S-box-containing protein